MWELPPVIGEALLAINSHETNRFINTFADDGAVDDWGRVFRGETEIRRWSESEFIGVKATLAITAVDTVGHTTTIVAEVGGDGFNGPSTFAFTVDQTGTLINLMRISA